MEEGTDIGHAMPVDIVDPEEPGPQREMEDGEQPRVNKVTDGEGKGEREQSLKKMLVALLEGALMDTPCGEKDQLIALLEEYHEAFSLVDGERGKRT